MSSIKFSTEENTLVLDTTQSSHTRKVVEAVNRKGLFNYIDTEVIPTGLVIKIEYAADQYYGTEDQADDMRKRNKRKVIRNALKAHYGNDLCILSIRSNEPEVIFGANAIKETIKSSNDQHVVKLCALKLRDAVLNMRRNLLFHGLKS